MLVEPVFDAHQLIENLKSTVRLRSGVDPQGFLTDQGIANAVETIALFVKFCLARQVKRIIAVATAAVRQAANGRVLVDRIRLPAGVPVQVLSGAAEAYRGYKG